MNLVQNTILLAMEWNCATGKPLSEITMLEPLFIMCWRIHCRVLTQLHVYIAEQKILKDGEDFIASLNKHVLSLLEYVSSFSRPSTWQILKTGSDVSTPRQQSLMFSPSCFPLPVWHRSCMIDRLDSTWVQDSWTLLPVSCPWHCYLQDYLSCYYLSSIHLNIFAWLLHAPCSGVQHLHRLV